MISAFHCQLNKIFKFALALILSICVVVMPFAEQAQAGRTSMTGDYVKDTLNVAKALKEEVVSEESDESQFSMSDEETVFLITDYISRYRNRSQINKTVSFTTMQTALNALAGHYKTFPNRAVPENLKNRLSQELSKAEDLVLEKE